MTSRAWVTLATNDSYGLGALVLAHSLRRAGSAYPAVVLITPSVTEPMRERLNAVFAEVVTVDVLDSGDAAHLALLQRPELGITFTKIHCWNLTQYEKCVFLDADTLVVQNCDELFDRKELSAAPDVGWPDCFNSGVFVFRPSAETYSSLITFAQERGSFDGGDQGLLNSYFSDWAHGDINKHLPFLYNVTSAAFYSYLPAFKQYGQNLKIIHFIGAAKPWLQHFNWESRNVDAPEHLREFLQLWWDLFVSQVHTQLDPSMVEVEDIPTAIVPSQETFFHIEPRSDYNHYKPVLSPDSEFHWHRPDAQTTQTEVIVPTIDMSQFHDPWDIYRGQIPAIADEAKSTCSYVQATDKQQDIRKHIWEPSCVQQIQNHTEPQYTDTQYYGSHHNEINHHETYHIETFHMDNQHIEAHNTEIAHEHGTQITWPWSNNTQHYHHHDYYENQHHQEVQHRDYYDYSNKQIESPSSYSFDQQSIHHSNDSNDHNKSSEHQGYGNREYQSSQHSDILLSQFNNQREPSLFQEHYSPQLEFYGNNNHEHTTITLDKYEGNNSSQEENHNKDINHNNNLYNIHKNDEQVHNYEAEIDQNKLTIHVQNNTEKFIYPVKNRVEYVYCVHFDHEKENNCQKQKLKSLPVSDTQEKINGFATESEMEDFIIPRHPYDGFYLRHRMTIDSRGRKICTHEIPPTPSPSPPLSPSESPIFFDAISEFLSSEETFVESDEQYHSGVAGNLARVSPDAVAMQQEAIDELTRRQGWEAGSIDYMGADSFANIWAKISQTLSQAPAPVQKLPTPPPEELPSAKESDDQPKAVVTDAFLPTTDEQPIETKDDSSKEKTPAESSAPTQPSIPVDRPVTSDITAASESTVSLEAIKQPAEAAPINVAASVTKSISPEAPADVKTSSIEATSVAPISEETSTSIEAPLSKCDISKDISKVPEDSPVEIPVPVVEAVLAEVAASTDSATPTSEIPKPVIEAFSDAESLKETKSETTTIVAASEKTVEPPKEKSDESVKPPEPEAPKQGPKSVLAESVQVETSAADPKSPAVAAEAPASPAIEESTKTEDKPSQPEDVPVTSATDSPPLANTPSKEEIPTEPAAKSEERRRPVGKLHLCPPVAADPLPTPDSELEDADTLAQSIIASELRTPTVTSPSPQTPASPAQPKQEKRLSVEEPKVPTPPIGSVSLSQIGVKSAKEKSTIAAQIESSISDKPMPASPTTTDPKASVEAPKKKVVKKVLKKDSATSGDAPVPPPRKKEKKPKE